MTYELYNRFVVYKQTAASTKSPLTRPSDTPRDPQSDPVSCTTPSHPAPRWRSSKKSTESPTAPALTTSKPFTEDVPAAGPHEILLEIKAVSLNYRDLAVANGQYPFPVKKNVVPVSDCAAVVSAIGANVTNFAVGDTVLVTFDGTNLYGQQKDWNGGHGGPVDGFLRQYAAVNESYAVKVPPTNLSYPELASLVCTGVTAWNALYGVAPTKPGDVILVQGEQAWTRQKR